MAATARTQRGGFFLGTVVGLLIGLVLALGVALYVTKVPVPFVDKVPQRTPEQDAAEAERNRTWDPNAGLNGRGARAPEPAASTPPVAGAASAPPTPAPAPAVAPPVARAASAAEAARSAASTARAGEGMQFYVQVGAYARTEDAEQQRARLGMSGLIGRISERDQGGKLVYRVRLGPFDARDEAETVREQAVAAGFADATLVRVPPPAQN